MERRNLTYEENKKANLLCVVSLVLMFAPLLLYCAGLEIADTYLNIDFTGSFAHLCTYMGQLFVGGCAIASLAVMIYVRVKYPQNTFGKVIMWLYIVCIVLGLLYIAVLIIACGIALNACLDGLKGCGNIGAVQGIVWRL